MLNEVQNETRLSFSNFIGAMISSSSLADEKAIKHEIIAVLLEESLKISTIDGQYDLFAIKPIFRAVINILNQRIKLMAELPLTDEVSNTIKVYKEIVKQLNSLLEKINLN